MSDPRREAVARALWNHKRRSAGNHSMVEWDPNNGDAWFYFAQADSVLAALPADPVAAAEHEVAERYLAWRDHTSRSSEHSKTERGMVEHVQRSVQLSQEIAAALARLRAAKEARRG